LKGGFLGMLGSLLSKAQLDHGVNKKVLNSNASGILAKNMRIVVVVAVGCRWRPEV
jgi:hypothetical protein